MTRSSEALPAGDDSPVANRRDVLAPGRGRLRRDRGGLADRARAGARRVIGRRGDEPAPAFPAQGDAGHLLIHARRPEPPGDLRPQAGPPAPLRPAVAGQLRPCRDAPAGGGQPAARDPADVPTRRQQRPAGLRLPAASRRVCRRAGGDPLVQGRQRQPSPGRLPDEHRLGPDGQAEPGELGRLRPGHREPGPAGVRGAARSRWRHQGRSAGVWCRASCRPAIRERLCGRDRGRSSTWRHRRGCPTPPSGGRST